MSEKKLVIYYDDVLNGNGRLEVDIKEIICAQTGVAPENDIKINSCFVDSQNDEFWLLGAANIVLSKMFEFQALAAKASEKSRDWKKFREFVATIKDLNVGV